MVSIKSFCSQLLRSDEKFVLQPNCHQFGSENDYMLTLDSFLKYRASAVVSCYEVIPSTRSVHALEVLTEHLQTRIVCGGPRYGAGSLFEIRDGKISC